MHTFQFAPPLPPGTVLRGLQVRVSARSNKKGDFRAGALFPFLLFTIFLPFLLLALFLLFFVLSPLVLSFSFFLHSFSGNSSLVASSPSFAFLFNFFLNTLSNIEITVIQSRIGGVRSTNGVPGGFTQLNSEQLRYFTSGSNETRVLMAGIDLNSDRTAIVASLNSAGLEIITKYRSTSTCCGRTVWLNCVEARLTYDVITAAPTPAPTPVPTPLPTLAPSPAPTPAAVLDLPSVDGGFGPSAGNGSDSESVGMNQGNVQATPLASGGLGSSAANGDDMIIDPTDTDQLVLIIASAAGCIVLALVCAIIVLAIRRKRGKSASSPESDNVSSALSAIAESSTYDVPSHMRPDSISNRVSSSRSSQYAAAPNSPSYSGADLRSANSDVFQDAQSAIFDDEALSMFGVNESAYDAPQSSFGGDNASIYEAPSAQLGYEPAPTVGDAYHRPPAVTAADLPDIPS